VYQFLVKRHLRKQFDRLSVGDYESVLRGVDDHVHHPFASQHPLAGSATPNRHSGCGFSDYSGSTAARCWKFTASR
jgi:hypothetical protein